MEKEGSSANIQWAFPRFNDGLVFGAPGTIQGYLQSSPGKQAGRDSKTTLSVLHLEHVQRPRRRPLLPHPLLPPPPRFLPSSRAWPPHGPAYARPSE
jgi:hypothetical protein